MRAELERRDLDHRTVPVYETASMEELAGEIQLTLRTLGTDAMLFTEVGSNTILGDLSGRGYPPFIPAAAPMTSAAN